MWRIAPSCPFTNLFLPKLNGGKRTSGLLHRLGAHSSAAARDREPRTADPGVSDRNWAFRFSDVAPSVAAEFTTVAGVKRHVPLHLMDFPPFGVYAWFDSGYMHCRIWQLTVQCLRCLGNRGISACSSGRLCALCIPLYSACVFGPTVDARSRTGVLVLASGRQNFVKF